MELFLDSFFIFLTKIYLAKGSHQTVVVSGSVGKTSTTQAIATTLSQNYTVKATKRNYNTRRGVALTVFDESIPASRLGWARIALRVCVSSIFRRPDFSILVLELGSDAPGDLKAFSFLKPDIGVVTAVSEEHMEYFRTIDAVAQEELSIAQYSEKVVVNSELVLARYIEALVPEKKRILYGPGTTNNAQEQNGHIVIAMEGTRISSDSFALIGRSGLSTLCATACVAKLIGMDGQDIKTGLEKIHPVPGRMNKFVGIKGSTIIDDTYNSSPEALRAALDYLYAQKATKRIALLGMMNEMGEHSAQLHARVGSWCDPQKLDLVVTLGADAHEYIAKEAEKNGCKVVCASNPRTAGEVIAKELAMGAVVLAKGSQNGVYAEEAIKLLLADPADATSLVRQDSYWPTKKGEYFVSIP